MNTGEGYISRSLYAIQNARQLFQLHRFGQEKINATAVGFLLRVGAAEPSQGDDRRSLKALFLLELPNPFGGFETI